MDLDRSKVTLMPPRRVVLPPIVIPSVVIDRRPVVTVIIMEIIGLRKNINPGNQRDHINRPRGDHIDRWRGVERNTPSQDKNRAEIHLDMPPHVVSIIGQCRG
jgi:hypothetical protein